MTLQKCEILYASISVNNYTNLLVKTDSKPSQQALSNELLKNNFGEEFTHVQVAAILLRFFDRYNSGLRIRATKFYIFTAYITQCRLPFGGSSPGL